MISLKLTSVLVLFGIIVLCNQKVNGLNITDACIKKSPSIEINSIEKSPSNEQRSLVFIFDTSGSMQDDLEAYKNSAKEIVNEFLSQDKNKIFNYILVGFSDPDVRAPFVTENVTDFIQELKKVEIVSSANFDCPENVLSGLKVGLDAALPNSIVYLFTDAPANDFELFESVSTVILKKQIKVNFLISDSCGQRDHNDEKYKVFTKISNLVNGLTYEVEERNLNDILQSIKDEINSNHKILKTFVSENDKKMNFYFYIDETVSELKVTIAGRSQDYIIKNPSDAEAQTKQKFTTNGFKILYFKKPMQGAWNIAAKDDYVTISVISELEFDFGFSADIVDDKSETVSQPISEIENVLSIFVPDSSKINKLSKVSLLVAPMHASENSTEISYNLNQQSFELYATNPFQLPKNPFKIFLEGEDTSGNKILRTISSILHEDPGTAPEITIEAEKLEFYEGQNLLLQCNVKSLVPVDIAWAFNGKILESHYSIQIKELNLSIPSISYDKRGVYKCIAANQVGCETQEVRVGITKIPKLTIDSSSTKMIENLTYVLTCQLDGIIKGQEIEYSWIDKDGNSLKDVGNTYSVIPIAEDNNKVIECQANCSDFTIESSLILNINFAPRFSTDLNTNIVTYGSKAALDCSSTENPPKNLVIWNFIANNSTKPVVIDGKNESIFEIQETYEQDEGTYECIVGNELGQINRDFVISLTPKESPKILPVKNAVVNETENIKIFCDCKNCLPISNYSWTFNNLRNYEVQTGQNEKENYFNTFIIINNTNEFDTGSFECQIVNKLGEDKATINVKIQTAPKVENILVKGENDTEVNGILNILKGEDVTVECIGSGQPSPKISWFKDNQEISNGSMLEITNATLDDEGEFECIIENLIRVVRRSIQIYVNFIPKRISETSTELIVIEGKEAIIKCDLTGKPLPEISWYVNSKRLENSDKYNISEDTLKFIAESDDSGIYKCKGDNQFGSVEIDFVFKVQTFPRIFPPNEELIKVELNTQLKLSCEATGYPVPQIMIFKNDIEISNKSIFTIDSTASSDAGSYHCNADNEMGHDEKIFYVSVIQKPLITSNFKNITLYTNQTKSLTCLADGIPKPDIKWRLNSKELLSTENSIKLDSDFESGKISCIAENSEGIAERHFYLEVVNIPILHSLANQLQTNITIREGDDLELLCPVDNYRIIKWTHNGSPFKVPDFRQADKKLIVYNAKKSYSGLWTCSAFLTKNSTDFSYKVVVLSPPVILASWNFNSSITDFDKNDVDIDQKVFWKGGSFVLNCTADGHPMPNVEWRKGSVLVGRGDVLSVDNLQLFHSDIYSCTAENKHGTVKRYFKVDILSAPHVDESAKVTNNINGESGESVTINCPIIGNPEPLFSWYKGNEIYEDENEDFLIIERVSLSDEGNYSCLARNKYGKENIHFDLTLNEPVQILEAIEQEKTQKDDEFVTLSCITKGYPLPVISWILNGRILSTTSKFKINEVFNASDDNFLYFDGNGNEISYSDPPEFNISNNVHYSKLTKLDKKSLQLDLIIKNNKDNLHLKMFTCNIFNALGHEEKSVNTVYNQEPYIEEKDKPKQIEYKILEHLPLQLTCMFDGYPVPEITWYKDDIQIFDNGTLKFVNDRKILNIQETSSWHSGNYTCAAENKIGTNQLTFDVLILSPPRIVLASKISDGSSENSVTEYEETIEAIRGEDVIIECSVEASPKAKIHWIKINDYGSSNGRILLDEVSNQLIIKSIKENANYHCFANNTVGYIQKSYAIKVYYPPEFIDNKDSDQDLIVKLHNHLILECKVDGFPEPETFWSFNLENITAFGNMGYLYSQNQVLRIFNANRNHNGKFTCTSFNRFGTIHKSFNVKIDIPVRYTDWSKWSECTEFCGPNGTQFRTRICMIDDIPSSNCTENTREVRKCSEFPCPINGGFSSWSDWSECPTCYDILSTEKPRQNRSRTCDSPEPAHGGLKCKGNEIEEKECDIIACSVDGGWGNWSNWSVCPACYNENEKIPLQTKVRKCDSPAPQNGGFKCEGIDKESRECKEMKFCPIDGGWSKWSDWSGCTSVYGQGTQYRIRYCIRPEPKYNGNECIGLPQEKRSCEVVTCNDDETIEAVNTRLQRLVLPQRSSNYNRSNSQVKCGRGYKPNFQNRCIDIDECRECSNRNLCNKNEICINSIGSYRCREL